MRVSEQQAVLTEGHLGWQGSWKALQNNSRIDLYQVHYKLS